MGGPLRRWPVPPAPAWGPRFASIWGEPSRGELHRVFRDSQRKHVCALSPGSERTNVPGNPSVIAGSVLAARCRAVSPEVG